MVRGTRCAANGTGHRAQGSGHRAQGSNWQLPAANCQLPAHYSLLTTHSFFGLRSPVFRLVSHLLLYQIYQLNPAPYIGLDVNMVGMVLHGLKANE